MFETAKELYYVQYESAQGNQPQSPQPMLYSGQVEVIEIGKILPNQKRKESSLNRFWTSPLSRSPSGTYLPLYGELSFEEIRLNDHEAKENFQFVGSKPITGSSQNSQFERRLSKLSAGMTRGIKLWKTYRRLTNDTEAKPKPSPFFSTVSPTFGHVHDFAATQACSGCCAVLEEKPEHPTNQPQEIVLTSSQENDANIEAEGNTENLSADASKINEIPMEGIQYGYLDHSEYELSLDTSTNQPNESRKKIKPRRTRPLSGGKGNSNLNVNESNPVSRGAVTARNDLFEKSSYRGMPGKAIHKSGVQSIKENSYRNQRSPGKVMFFGTSPKKGQPNNTPEWTPLVYDKAATFNAGCKTKNSLFKSEPAIGFNVVGQVSQPAYDASDQSDSIKCYKRAKERQKMPKSDKNQLSERNAIDKDQIHEFNSGDKDEIPEPIFSNKREMPKLNFAMQNSPAGGNRPDVELCQQSVTFDELFPKKEKKWHNANKQDITVASQESVILQPISVNELCISESTTCLNYQKLSKNAETPSNIEEFFSDVASSKTRCVYDSGRKDESSSDNSTDTKSFQGGSKIDQVSRDSEKVLDTVDFLTDNLPLVSTVDTIPLVEDERKHTGKQKRESNFTEVDKNETVSETVNKEPSMPDCQNCQSDGIGPVSEESPSRKDTSKAVLNVLETVDFCQKDKVRLPSIKIEQGACNVLMYNSGLSPYNKEKTHNSSDMASSSLSQDSAEMVSGNRSLSEQTTNKQNQAGNGKSNEAESWKSSSSSFTFASSFTEETFTSSELNTSPVSSFNFDDYFMFCKNDFEHIFGNYSSIELDFACNPFSHTIATMSPSDRLIGLQDIRIKDRIVRVIPHGKGTLQTTDGCVIYCGEFVMGKRDGFGSATILPLLDSMHVSAGYYQGNWKNNYRNGRGKMAFLSGRLYEGSWYLDKMQGKGSLLNPDGSSLEGHFVDGRPDGCCTLHTHDGHSEQNIYYVGQPASPGDEKKRDQQHDYSEKDPTGRISRQYYFNSSNSVNNREHKMHLSKLLQSIHNQTASLLSQYSISAHDTIASMLKETLGQITALSKSYEERMVSPLNDLRSIRQEIGKMSSGLNKVSNRCNDMTRALNQKQTAMQDALKELQGSANEERISREERASLREEVQRLKDEKEKLEDLTKCQICHEKTRDCIIMPCMHMKTCSHCLRTIRNQNRDARCPICRGAIQGEIHCKL